MVRCINLQSPEVAELAKILKNSKVITATKLAVWQKAVEDTSAIPTAAQLDYIKSPSKANVILGTSYKPEISNTQLKTLIKIVDSLNLKMNKQGVKKRYRVETRIGTNPNAYAWVLLEFDNSIKLDRRIEKAEEQGRYGEAQRLEFMRENNSQLGLFTDDITTGSSKVDYVMKAVSILSTSKADEIFRKGNKNNWNIDKILTELQVPKEQKELIKSFNTRNREEILTSLLANYSYTVEINTAKELKQSFYEDSLYRDVIIKNGYEYNKDSLWKSEMYGDGGQIKITQEEYDNVFNDTKPTQHYSNLTVPGGINGSYIEANIETPMIVPSIQSHAQFKTDNTIGWMRADEKQNYQEKDIDNLIEIMKKSGILEVNCG